ncbi:MAG TPA: flagellar hook-length control protein FliK [Firmicutes bacterium]|nr:flagellar hook-length control protein FliK [Candidatus Fermentithermobacillaceae bacterium]
MISEIEIGGQISLPTGERQSQKKTAGSTGGAFESLLMAAGLLFSQYGQTGAASSGPSDLSQVHAVRVDSLLEGPAAENRPAILGNMTLEAAPGHEFALTGLTLEAEHGRAAEGLWNETGVGLYESDLTVEIPGFRGNVLYQGITAAAHDRPEGPSEGTTELEALSETGLPEEGRSLQLPDAEFGIPADADLSGTDRVAEGGGPRPAPTTGKILEAGDSPFDDRTPRMPEAAEEKTLRSGDEDVTDSREGAGIERVSAHTSGAERADLFKTAVKADAGDAPDHPRHVLDLTKPREIAQSLYRESLKKLPRTVELRLDPPELGKVTVLLTARGEQVAVRFLAESQEARRALAEAASDLSLALQEHGLVLTGAVVDNGSSHTNAHEWDKRLAKGAGPKVVGIRGPRDVPEVFGFSSRADSALDYWA